MVRCTDVTNRISIRYETQVRIQPVKEYQSKEELATFDLLHALYVNYFINILL